MSTSLTDPALGTEAEVPSVEEQAPAATTEVVEGSVKDENSVPVSRFNGLMSSFNKVQNEKTLLETQLAELRSELAKPAAPTKETTPTMSDDVLSEVQQLRTMLMEERLNGARRAALDEFPDAKPFADLIVADTAEDVRDLARLISERLQASRPATSTEVTEEAPAATEAESVVEPVVEAPVTGGGSGYVQEAAVEDRVAQAVKKRSFSDFLGAKWEAHDAGQTLEATG